MTRRQLWRTRLHLAFVGLRRRMVIGARLALFIDGKVLLVRHTYMPGWHFPGGGVEPGETAGDCARREGIEETGFRADGPLKLLGFYLKADEATNRDHVAVYVGTAATREREFRANGEIAGIGWFRPDALPVDTDPGTGRRIRELSTGSEVADRW